MLGRAAQGYHHTLKHDPRDRLPVGGRRRGCVPQRRYVLDEAPHASFVRLAQLLGLVLHGSTMIVTELPLGHERSVPVPLQRVRYQPIVRIEALVAPPRQRGRVGGRLQPLFPLAMQLPAFEFEIFSYLEVDLDCRTRDCRRHGSRDGGVHAMRADELTARRTEGRGYLAPDITRLAAIRWRS